MDDDALERAARALLYRSWWDDEADPPEFDLSDEALQQPCSFYNWRSYVPALIAPLWPHLTRRERILVLVQAYQAAQDALDHAD